MSKDKTKLLPGIKEYLATTDLNVPIPIDNLDELVHKVMAGTGLSKVQSALIVQMFFEEVRTNLVLGRKVYLPRVGILSAVTKFYFKPYAHTRENANVRAVDET